jgi:8-amino-7-oxononanoate synthase
MTNDLEKTLKLSEKLRAKGYWILPIRPPTVPRNQCRLRFSLSYAHSGEILEELIKDINEAAI